MSSQQCPEQLLLRKGALENRGILDDSVREARQGTNLARALIQHVCAMRAAGYEDEVMVDGEIWGVEVRHKSRFC